MALTVTVSAGARPYEIYVREPGTPVALFRTRIWGGGTNATQGAQYDVSSAGRFLLNVAIDDVAMAPISLLLNWKLTP